MPQKINMCLTTNKTITSSSIISSNSILRQTTSNTLSTLGNLKQIYMNKNPSCG